MGKIKYWLIVGFIILFAIFYIAISDRDSTLSRLKSAGENGDVEACAGQTRCDVCKWSRGKSGLSAIKIMV